MRWGSSFTFVLFLTTAPVAKAAIGPVATLYVVNKNISPDGFTRPASVVNGAHPGPLIIAKKGETFKLNAVNQLSDITQERGTSIHWHGLFQKGTNFMDGAAGITQCPIAPGNAFQYSFSADSAGTFWYHSHFGLQYCDGVRGPIVIYDPSDPLKAFYDESTVITLSEWYHTVASSISGIPVADSTLINGKGRFPGGPKTDLAAVNVQQGKRYRLRVISISCGPSFTFSIDDHNLRVIEVEGNAVRPITVNSVNILAGQRYSIVLDACQPIGNYWIRAMPSSGRRNLPISFDGGINSAILRYKGAPNSEPTSVKQTTTNALVETDLHPLVSPFAPGRPQADGADMTVNLTFGFDPTTKKYSVNGAVFEPPSVPVLLQILNGARTPEELLPAGGVITVPRNKVIQVNVPSGLRGGPHPLHMHGHDFSVVRCADAGHFNFLDPVRRDVVNMGQTRGDFVSIRFKTDNPGPWIFHCHIDFHLGAGLAIVFAEAPYQTPKANPAPESWKNLCPIWDALPDDIKHTKLADKGVVNVTPNSRLSPCTIPAFLRPSWCEVSGSRYLSFNP
ncbi:multicopper oxidase [Macrolepiota fuliginosa MF-IS2]|uniref:Multicopper oxidase n=1 Tax=Macrolepiota fuliginosa MF-IS2 TaxID=1400762 RepID=A0A9P5X6Q8_9AGAR|nr:multicopper oxidase [Macrolepiota fuliginosa MF-IS2]